MEWGTSRQNQTVIINSKSFITYSTMCKKNKFTAFRMLLLLFLTFNSQNSKQRLDY